jgi:hypothetical protein
MREAQPLPFDEGVHHTGEAKRVERRPDEVDASRSTRGGELVGGQPGRQVHRDRQRHDVDTEDPSPVQRVDQHSAEQRTDHESRSCPSGPGTDRAGLGCTGEAGVDHRERTRYQERRTNALQAPSGDKHPTGRRNRAQHRRDGEDREAHPQHREPAELVGDRPRDQDQRAEGEQIAIHDPLLQRQPGQALVRELPPDGGQCQVDHGSVEEGDE